MLTLRQPIQLHTGLPMTLGAEAFGERILGNYALLGAKYVPKDLLFLLTAPPELPVEDGGMTTLVENRSAVNIASVTMDVVNNVVNRILLDGSSQFTYQDQVYITSVLNRLGVTDVSQFISEVRRLRVENESTVHLHRLYQTELRQMLALRAAGEQTPVLPLPAPTTEAGEVQTPEPQTAMALSILQRLDTPRLYETVHAFQQSWSMAENTFHQNALQLSEQLRFSNSVALAETKLRVFQQPDITLHQHWNRYEHLDVARPASNEAQVLTQAAAAALVSAVDSTVVEVLNRPTLQNRWVRLQIALHRTAMNTLNRFEEYHTAAALASPTRQPPAENVWNTYAGELNQYRTLHLALHPEETAALPKPGEFPGMPTLTYPAPAESDAEAGVPGVISMTGQPPISETVRNTYVDEITQMQSLHLTLHPGETGEAPKPGEPPAPADLTHATAAEPTGEEAVPVFTPVKETAQPSVFPPKQTQMRPAETVYLTPEEAESLSPEALREEIARIDQKNRTLLEIVEREARQTAQTPPSPPPVPDVRRTMRDALRSLENPEEMLRELAAAPVPQVKRQLSPQQEALLAQADPHDRALYETVLAYQSDPEQVLRQGLLTPAGMDRLYADLKAAEPEPVELTYPETEPGVVTERLTQESERVLERLLPTVRAVVRTEAETPPAVKIVHKQIASEVSEELLEQLQESRKHTTDTIRSEENVDVQHMHTTDVRQLEQSVVTQTTEDITEIVNRTLARQMRTISDQVYRQMEKRLQTERSRRGRL